jgi:ABC-2 type transport system permease protein
MLQGLLQQAIFTADISKYIMPNMVEKMMRKKGENEAAISIAKLYINKYMVPNNKEPDTTTSKSEKSSDNGLFKDYPIGIASEQIVGNDVDTTAAYVQSVISAMLIFLMFSVTHGAGALIREKKRGTLKRLMLSPLSVGGILTGKLISIMLIGIVEIYFMLIVGWLIFGLQIWDYPVELFLMAFATAMMTSGLGVMLTGIAKTEEQVSMLATLVIITLNAIGGSMIPRFFMPDFMKKIGYISPVSWAIDGFHNVFWRHMGFGGMALEFGVLIAFALSFLLIGIILVRAKLKSL